MFPFLSIQTIKTPVFTLAITLVIYIFLELVKANIRHVAAAKGWDSFFLKVWDAIPEWGHKLLAGWAPIRERWWLWLSLGLSGGLSIALWLLAPAEMPPRGAPIVSPTPAMAPSTVITPPATQNQASIQSHPAMTSAPQPTVSAIETTLTKKDISRLLGELPELYELINVAKNSLLPQIQAIVNNSFLANGGSIHAEIEKANSIANDVGEYEKKVDGLTKDRYDSNILLGLIDGKNILHILEFHLLEYSRIMMPQFPHQPDNFDQYKWLLGNQQYLHERDLLNTQSEISKNGPMIL